MQVHTFILPDGREVKRTSENRTYTHVVVGHKIDQHGQTVYWVEGWSGSEALARKTAAAVQHRLVRTVGERWGRGPGRVTQAQLDEFRDRWGTLIAMTVHPVTNMVVKVVKVRHVPTDPSDQGGQ